MSGQKTITKQLYSGSTLASIVLLIGNGALAYDAVGDNHSADTERPVV
jgi:hypothetical protein